METFHLSSFLDQVFVHLIRGFLCVFHNEAHVRQLIEQIKFGLFLRAKSFSFVGYRFRLF